MCINMLDSDVLLCTINDISILWICNIIQRHSSDFLLFSRLFAFSITKLMPISPPNSYRLLFSWDGWFTESMFVAKNMLHLKSWKSIPLCHDPVFLNTHGPWPQINEMSLHLRSRLHIFWDPHFEYIPFQFCFKSHLSLLNLGEIHLCCRLFVLTSLFLFSSEQLGFNICPSTPQVHVWVCLKMGNTPQIEILFSGEHAD